MRIAVLGGGPGGLFLARLLKRADAALEIHVFEQNPPDATYGFGVGISMAARDRMRRYDPEVFDRLQASSRFNDRQRIAKDGEALLLEFAQGGGAIRRLELLRVLIEACRRAGVVLHFGRRMELDEVAEDFDLVVAADGAGSATRDRLRDGLQAVDRPCQNHFAWFGVARALAPSGLDFRKTRHGIFVAHYYAYSDSLSTFLPECNEDTWRRSGLAEMDPAQRKAYVEALFHDVLQGAPLVENRSIWRTFNAAYCGRWHHGKVIVIGDALRVAHFSIGSGTRLAMEDAMALADAVGEGGSVDDIGRRFQLARQPVRDRFAQAADRSIAWYETMDERMDLPLIEFTHDFLTRTGRVDDQRLAIYAPAFYRQWIRYRGASHAATNN